MLLQLPWVDADIIKKISRKGGARSVAELMRMGEQERLELFVTSGRGAYACFCLLLCSSCGRLEKQSGKCAAWPKVKTGKGCAANIDPRWRSLLECNCWIIIHIRPCSSAAAFPFCKSPQRQGSPPPEMSLNAIALLSCVLQVAGIVMGHAHVCAGLLRQQAEQAATALSALPSVSVADVKAHVRPQHLPHASPKYAL